MHNYLLPCALCGCTKCPVRQGNGIGDYWLECVECGMSTRLREDGDGIADWNRRPATTEKYDAQSVRDAALFDLLMQKNIPITDEAYLSLRCVGVPPSEKEFVSALDSALKSAPPQKPEMR